MSVFRPDLFKSGTLDAAPASPARPEIIANISHELRTPLNAIIGFSDMLHSRTSSDPERVHQYTGYIKEAAEHLLELVNGILDLSRIQSGRLSMECEPVDLGPIIACCLRILAAKARAKNITVDRWEPARLPLVLGDPLRLKQILFNLISNAVKFTPENGRVRVRTGTARQGHCVILVEDTGIGMSAAEIETALRPFCQVDTGFNRQHEGTGLGLPIAHALARLHGGDLTVVSEKGRGTIVALSLPLADGNFAAEEGG